MTFNLQNKANLQDTEMNVTASITKEYENLQLFSRCENKPNQTQFWLCNSLMSAQLKTKALKYTIGHYGKIYSR
jgi:hypothetical protein